MASDKPQKKTGWELRQDHQASCAKAPCKQAQNWIDGFFGCWPPCVICMHEKRFKR